MRPLLINQTHLDYAIAGGEDVLLLDATGAKRWDSLRYHPVPGGAAERLTGVPRFDLAGVGTTRDGALFSLPNAEELAECLTSLGAGPG